MSRLSSAKTIREFREISIFRASMCKVTSSITCRMDSCLGHQIHCPWKETETPPPNTAKGSFRKHLGTDIRHRRTSTWLASPAAKFENSRLQMATIAWQTKARSDLRPSDDLWRFCFSEFPSRFAGALANQMSAHQVPGGKSSKLRIHPSRTETTCSPQTKPWTRTTLNPKEKKVKQEPNGQRWTRN
jgi:hypothetical protein